MEFIPFPKIGRLSREMVITEKLDGTNAQVAITTTMEVAEEGAVASRSCGEFGQHEHMFAGSRTRWVQPGKQDNAGFAGWVQRNADALWALGPGSHFGEWWGNGIQRGYGLPNGDKRFSLFNVGRWNLENVPNCCSVVPTLYTGPFHTDVVDEFLADLKVHGSYAAPFMNPEGIVIFHTATGTLFKKTVVDDEKPKALAA